MLMRFWHCLSCVPAASAADVGQTWLCFSAPWSLTTVMENTWGLPGQKGRPHVSSQSSFWKTSEHQRLWFRTTLLCILWKQEPFSVHAKFLHGPPAVFNHHGCPVGKRVVFRNGSPVPFPVLLHSSFHPLALFHGPLLQRKTTRPIRTCCHLPLSQCTDEVI